MKNGTFGLWLWCTFPVYLGLVFLIGWTSRRRKINSSEFLNAPMSLPLWAVALSFLAYNCGSIEILGMSAMALQYGVQALHFYWIGGIPGLVFMGLVVVPVYMRTGARSLPEFLERRFGPAVRLTSATLSALCTAAFSGVTLYGLALVLHIMAGWSIVTGTVISACAVCAYVLVGGLRATIYTSVFQLAVLIGGLTPLLFLTVHSRATTFALRSERWHLWRSLPAVSPYATLDRFGVVLGLGFVISFSYWCTDFVMIQRALTARSVEAARRVPLLAGFGKMAIAFFVVLPAVAAPSLLPAARSFSFDEVLPRLLSSSYGPVLLAIGAAALMAGLMAGMAGNISGFAALWTEEIYRPCLRPNETERHYVRVGRISILACVLIALLVDYATFRFRDMMELLQLILALSYAPVFAVVLLGVATKRPQARGAMAGILGGVLSGIALQCMYWARYLQFGSQMSANFYTAIVDFLIALLLCRFVAGGHREDHHRLCAEGTSASSNLRALIRPSAALVGLSLMLLGSCLVLNLLWR